MCQFLTGVGTITTAWSCCSGDETLCTWLQRNLAIAIIQGHRKQPIPIFFLLMEKVWNFKNPRPVSRFIALSLYRFIALSLYRFIALSLYRFIALSLYRLIEPSAPESQSFRNLISIGFNNATRLTLCHITMLNAIHLEGQPSLHKEPIDRSKLEVGVLVKGDKHLHLESRPLDRPQKIVYP